MHLFLHNVISSKSMCIYKQQPFPQYLLSRKTYFLVAHSQSKQLPAEHSVIIGSSSTRSVIICSYFKTLTSGVMSHIQVPTRTWTYRCNDPSQREPMHGNLGRVVTGLLICPPARLGTLSHTLVPCPTHWADALKGATLILQHWGVTQVS